MKSNYFKLVLAAVSIFCILEPAAAQEWSWYLNHDFMNPTGVNPPRNNSPYLYDIDSDSDLDLILGQGDGTIVLYYNDGFPDVQRWRLDEDYFASLTFDLAIKPSLGDFDGDDSLELVLGFAYYDFPADSLRAFRNRGTSENPVWQEVTGFFNISTEGYTYHKFNDWDNDGDYDLILCAGDGWETPYLFFRNAGTPGEPAWYPDSALTDAFPSGMTPCGNEGFDIVDLNFDGAKDFVSAYLVCDAGSQISIYLNNGTNESPVFGEPESSFAPYLGWQIGLSIADMDTDGDLDIISAGYYPLVIYLENCGNAQSPIFDGDCEGIILGPFYIDGACDMGFFDRDNDDDLDFALFQSFVLMPFPEAIIFIEGYTNFGTNHQPEFARMDWFPWGYTQFTDMALATGDINGDGWEDIVFSMYGRVITYINIPYSLFAMDTTLFSDINISVKHPTLIDLDLDGDLDLLVIDITSHQLTAFENTGSAQEPSWEQRDQWADDLDRSAVYAKPADLNGDARPDLILEVDNHLKGYLHTGNQNNPEFEYLPEIFESGQDIVVGYYDAADLDGDGDDDVVLNNDGSILFLENESTLDVRDEAGPPDDYLLLSNYPNPFNAATTISFSLPNSAHVKLSIFDISGRLVRVLVDGDMDSGNHGIAWDGSDASGEIISSGVYFYSLRSGAQCASKRMLLLR